MKTRLQLLLSGVFVCCSLLFTSSGYSQINYSENFEGATISWPEEDFELVEEDACNGDGSIQGNPFSFFGLTFPAENTSDAIGVSNGQVATITYSYKLTEFEGGGAMPNSPSWGSVTMQYGTSPTGPWTTIETITPANHTVSATCAPRTATFTPMPGAQVYLKVVAQPGAGIDMLVTLDDITVTQPAATACTGTPAASATVASSGLLCNGQEVTLSLNPFYTNSGLTFQWQSSTDNVTYTNIPTGGTLPYYATTQTASTWYRATIACTAGGTSVTSTPVQVISTGADCPCEVVFDSNIEPITLVEFAGINNVSGAAVDGSGSMEDFTNLPPAQVTQGETYDIALEGNTNDPDMDGYETYFTVFIDWNHDGDFTDQNERYNIGFITLSDGEDGVQATGEIEVPANALPGLTYMRVFKLYDEFPDAPCGEDGEFGYGQVEDYLINVTAGTACTTPAPGTDNATQTFCDEAELEDLDLNGTGTITWYADATGGTALDESMDAVSGTTYYAAQTIDDCESTSRTAVTVMITVTPAPEGDETQTIEGGVAEDVTLADIEVTGTGTITWYATEENAENGVDPLPADTQLTDGETYYATNTAATCESEPLAVTVSVVLGTGSFAEGAFRYYPNPVKDVLTLSYDRNIARIEVYNIVGQVVKSQNIGSNEAQADLSQLVAGTYLVKVTGDDASKTIKVVKQ